MENKMWTSIKHPDDELQKLMWGNEGTPIAPRIPTPPPTPTTTSTTTTTTITDAKATTDHHHHCRTHLPISDDKDPHVFSDSEDEISIGDVKFAETPGNGMMDVAWKMRSGLGKFSMQNWERRMLILDGNTLFYYRIKPDGDIESKPRGKLDLDDNVTIETSGDGSAPTDFELLIQGDDDKVSWRFAFDSGLIQKKWLVGIMGKVKSHGGKTGDGGVMDHGFEAGDHIIRWEILAIPIAYPIQIHGIVLEAGRNCVIIADFGMTSYYQQKQEEKKDNKDVPDKKEAQDKIGAAWDKIRPKDKQRLNVVALTDPAEIKKWSKINYGSTISKSSMFSGWFTKKEEEKNNGMKCYQPDWDTIESPLQEQQEQQPIVTNNDSITPTLSEPDWFRENLTPSTTNNTTPTPLPSPPPPQVFSIPSPSPPPPPSSSNPTSNTSKPPPKLPKSDPPIITLARANFLLEYGESILPPYHILYSNSECIAVWCKTGRFSTLQTAIFLHATAIGNAKSATALTISLAAVNAALIPVMAVGGVMAVTAPWWILKIGREKWEDATRHLGDLFWSWAGGEVYVAAIEAWSGLEEVEGGRGGKGKKTMAKRLSV